MADLFTFAPDRKALVTGGAFVPVPMDVTDDASDVTGVAAAATALSGLDKLVSSTGIFQFRHDCFLSEDRVALFDRLAVSVAAGGGLADRV
jgi:hypothetical protein